jgi:hypothetical protein
MIGWLCSGKIFTYKGVTFEIPGIGAPWPLKKNGDPRARAGKVFYRLIDEFKNLSEEEKKSCRVGGGCMRIDNVVK